MKAGARMRLDDYEFRPITFQGVTFPATPMGIFILEAILGIEDEARMEWVKHSMAFDWP